MSRRVNTYLVLLLLLGVLVLPALAGADSGGAGIGTGGDPAHPYATGTVQPGDVSHTVSGAGVTLSARISALLRHQLRFSGTVPESSAGKTVLIERLDKQTGWVPATTGVAAANGSFNAVWKTNRIGPMAVRVIVSSARGSSHITASSPSLSVTVYNPAIATTYGEGSWGSRTACGKTLTHRTLGVAHRWLPCGTRVAIYWRGRTLVVPVIDRGPYANHADWDLTLATASALGISGTETIGAVSLSSH